MTVNQRIKRAVEILKRGGLVAFPTETVYGLGGDACNPVAVDKIFEVKERPYHHPLIVHIADFSLLSNWTCVIPQAAEELARHFWPGPLTMLFQKHPNTLDTVTGGQNTIGIRVPRHPVAQELLSAFGGGIAAPSANKFTHISPTYAAAVREELGETVEMILDGGDCEVGLESTIIDMTSALPVILRPGMITRSAIEKVLGIELSGHSTQRVPGTHPLHYAPQTSTILLKSEDIPAYLQSQKEDRIALLTHKELGMNPDEYAHNLYRALRELDNQHFARIIIEEVPSSPEWEAIRDRLAKACARET